MTTPLLAFDEVTFWYPGTGRPVLQSLSLEIGAGSVTAILGPNGTGKTTLLQLALGWLAPRDGRVLLNGRPLAAYPRRALGRTMALVPQAERMPFDYDVTSYVMMGRAPHIAPLAMPGPFDLRIGEEALGLVGMASFGQRAITRLSGGERQLASVARALAQQPSLLLMDEPAAHLDLAHKARLIRLVRTLVSGGMTVLLTTHEPDVASALATDLVLMRDGRVYRTGTLDEVFTSEHLSATYGIPVDVAMVREQRVALWTS